MIQAVELQAVFLRPHALASLGAARDSAGPERELAIRKVVHPRATRLSHSTRRFRGCGAWRGGPGGRPGWGPQRKCFCFRGQLSASWLHARSGNRGASPRVPHAHPPPPHPTPLPPPLAKRTTKAWLSQEARGHTRQPRACTPQKSRASLCLRARVISNQKMIRLAPCLDRRAGRHAGKGMAGSAGQRRARSAVQGAGNGGGRLTAWPPSCGPRSPPAGWGRQGVCIARVKHPAAAAAPAAAATTGSSSVPSQQSPTAPRRQPRTLMNDMKSRFCRGP